MNDGQIKIKVDVDSKEAEKSMNKLQNAGKKLGNVGKKLTLGLTTPILGIATAAGKSAMELESTEAKFNTVFDNMADDVDNFIMSMKELAPMTKAEGRVLISGVQDMLVPLGIAREEATEMSKDFMHLAGALANAGDSSVTMETTMGAMQSALAGQMQPLRNLGVVTNAAEIEMKALEMTGKSTTKELEAQDKAAAILAIAYDQSADALSAFTLENQDTDTKMKIAIATFKDSLAILGEKLLPVIEKGIELLNQFSDWLGNLSDEQLNLLIKVGAFLAILGPLLLIISKLIVAVKIIGGVFLALTAPLLLKILIIGLIVAAILWLIFNFDKFIDFLKMVFDFWKQVFSDMWQIIKDTFNGIWETITTIFTSIWEKVKEIFNGVINWYKNKIIQFINVFLGAFNRIRNAFGSMWNGIINLFSKGGKIFNGIKDGIAGVFRSIVNNLIKGINRIISTPFNAVNRMLNRIRSISIMGAKPFSGLWSHNPVPTPKIPSLDVGTNMVRGDGLAFLHEGEAVVPKKYNPAMGGNGLMTLMIEQPAIELDGRRVSREMTPYITRTVKVGGGNV